MIEWKKLRSNFQNFHIECQCKMFQILAAYDIIISRTWYHIWYHNYVISQSDCDITVYLWYHIWCHRCISCDVSEYHMWYHVWYHTVISQLCDIIVQNLWYHMWNHRLQRNTSCVISHSFFHITPWYHIWYRLLKLWFDDANCNVQRIIGSAETS